MEYIKTRDFGDLPKEGTIFVTLRKPILGFEELSQYYVIPLKEPDSFTLLQSAEDIQVAFLMTQPRIFIKDYVLDVDDEDVKLLETDNHADLLDFAILTISDTIEDITMNILGPIIINTKNSLGIQTISNVHHYGTKCRLFLSEEKAAN